MRCTCVIPTATSSGSARGSTKTSSHAAGGHTWTPEDGLAFVEHHGVVLQAARGPVPSLAAAIAGGPIRGSWWAHPKGREIFRVSDAVSDSPDVLVCRLVEGKVTFVHRRLWPALVKLSSRFGAGQLDQTFDEHTSTGAHRARRTRFPEWVPREVLEEAGRLSIADAEGILSPWLPLAGRDERHPKPKGRRRA